MSQVPIILNKVAKSFGSVTALLDVSLRIEPGELFFLLGPSGCGKTTLLRHLAGFYTPDRGQIHFGDRDVTRTPPHARNTAMVFQSYALWPHLSVERNVAFGLEERKLPVEQIAERVQKALDMVKMSDFGHRKTTQLSGGQQQRVALARALVVEPDILLLDEPLSNLDTKLRVEMREEIRRLVKSAGLTAVYVTHDQKEALSVADRFAVMDRGRILQVGTPQEMYRDPATPFVAGFMGETNFIPGEIIRETSRNHLWAVQTPSGLFWGRATEADWQPQTGDKVVLSIRPESWRLEIYPEYKNCVSGQFKRAIYLGESAQYELESKTVGAIRLSEVNPHVLHPTDERTYNAVVSDEDVIMLRADEESGSS
ncbi:MAG: ABC transporter ATP-binding protein [Verrucomicrobiales bacterium]